MFIRALDGFYAGEVRDYPSHIALALIATGRAENPYAEPAARRIEVVPPVLMGDQVGVTRSKKRSRA